VTVSNNSLVWRDDTLTYRGREYARLIPDQVYPTMWRVRTADGAISDLRNRTRARDLARTLVLGAYNREATAGAGVRNPSSSLTHSINRASGTGSLPPLLLHRWPLVGLRRKPARQRDPVRTDQIIEDTS
jgi:hypothetical protein